MRATSDIAVQPREETSPEAVAFDLVSYAKCHRYRIRNLHDGNPVPPAIHKGPIDKTRGFWGENDRWDAIVGHKGYVAMDGADLTVCVFYKSAMGVNRSLARLQAIGASVDQVGDAEVDATVSPSRIEDVLKLIKVSKVPLRNPAGNPKSLRAPVSEPAHEPDSHERQENGLRDGRRTKRPFRRT